MVVVDDASGSADALVEFAATSSRFESAARTGNLYPGLLGPAPKTYVHDLVQHVLPLIAAHFGGGPVAPVRARGNFSLVTTPPDALLPDQRIPHVDTADRLQFAVVHFLSRDARAGTGFFRHRATGFETIDGPRLPRYRAQVDRELATLPVDDRCYPGGDDAFFEQIGAVEARYDRLVLYRAALLHSGLISAPPPDAANPRRGRLTGNLFLQCRPR